MLRKLILSLLKKIKFLPPDFYVKVYYEYYTGKKLNLENPMEFNEKIQWLKVYYHPPILTKLVDKYRVRDYVKEKIGEEYLNELILSSKTARAIDFDSLPDQFVAKGVHGCNFNLIVKNKNNLNKTKARFLFNKWLSKNQYYRGGLEWAYKNVPPRIIIEKYLEEPGREVLNDYKIYCFDGKPTFIQIDIDRGTDHKGLYYNTEWERLPFNKGMKKLFEGEIEKPKKLTQMLALAAILAGKFPFVRVDFYYVNHKIYFGEMTFYPGDGRQEFKPEEYNKTIGDHIKLPKIPKGQKRITEV